MRFVSRFGEIASALLFTMSLLGCGGGGSSNAGAAASNSGTPPVTSGTPPLVFTTDNASTVATLSFGYGGITLGIAQSVLDWAATVESTGAASTTDICIGGGSRTISWDDRDGNHHVSVGDQLTVALAGCFLKPLDDTFDGTLTVTFIAPGAGAQQAGVIAFGPKFGVHSINSLNQELTGKLRFDYSATSLSKALHAYSDPSAFGMTFFDSKKSVDDMITQLDALREVRIDTARATTTMRHHVVSGLLGGSFDSATTVPWSSWFDTYPDAGELTVTGAGNAQVKLRASSDKGNVFDVLSANTTAGSISADGTGYLWSSTGWLAQDNTTKDYGTQFPSMSTFHALLQPSASIRPSDSLVWLYSRPLAAGTLTGATFVRTNPDLNSGGLSEDISASVDIQGAKLTVTPNVQLQPGGLYTIVFDNTYLTPIRDSAGDTTERPNLSVTVIQTIAANVAVPSPAILFGRSATLSLDASASSANGSAVTSTHWSQVSGPALTISGADTAHATFSPASAENGRAVVEVRVANALGEFDRKQVAFPVFGDTSNALVIGYRSGDGQTNIVSNLDSNGSAYYARDFQGDTVLDVYAGFQRFLAGLPSGAFWQTGLDLTYGSSSTSGVTGGWTNASAGCAVTGHFSVLDFALDAAGQVSRLALDFEDTCSNSPTTYGSIRYNSDLPLRP